jgi:hypothetical protein
MWSERRLSAQAPAWTAAHGGVAAHGGQVQRGVSRLPSFDVASGLTPLAAGASLKESRLVQPQERQQGQHDDDGANNVDDLVHRKSPCAAAEVDCTAYAATVQQRMCHEAVRRMGAL